MLNLFDDEILMTKEEKLLVKTAQLQKEKEVLEAKTTEKNAKEQERLQKKLITDQITDSAFWLAYCGMQKAIRQGMVDTAKKLGYIVWLKNPWLCYRRLYTILFEDIGAANIPLVYEFKDFAKNGKSYKNMEDVLSLVEALAKSVKNRDGDSLDYVVTNVNRYPDFPENAIVIENHKELIAGQHDKFASFRYYRDIDIYKTEERLADILAFSKYMMEKMTNETQPYAMPYIFKYFYRQQAKGIMGITENTCTSPSHGLLYRDIIPLTILDTHAAHGKMTMEILKKKLMEKKKPFLEKYNLITNIDKVPFLLFLYEGAGCTEEMSICGIREAVEITMATDICKVSRINYEEFRADFKENVLDGLVALRTWVFEKKLNNHVECVIKMLKDYEG